MKVLALPRYGDLGASSRLRISQYLPYLRAAGMRVESSELLDDDYVRQLYKGQHALKSIVCGYLNRFLALNRAQDFDVVLVEKESLPWLPAFVELNFYRNVRLWLDYDDAVFHRYDRHSSSLVRSILGQKHDEIMRRAELVTVGNGYLAARAHSAGSQWIERVPTVINLEKYSVSPKYFQEDKEVVIGWIGSPSTAGYLQLVSPAISALASKYSVRCIAIGARDDQVSNTPFKPLPWTEATEVSLLQAIDIGIMPLPDTPWERGKCGYKIIQYMASNLPVVASPVGVNEEIVRHGENGFLASTDDEWLSALELLVKDTDLRKRMGASGRAQVEREYCSQVQGPRLVGMLQRLGAPSCVV